jgi:flagellar biogenesis protein FliO
MDTRDMDVLREILAIAFVFALLGSALWLLKRRNGAGISLANFAGLGTRDLQLIESRAKLVLSSQHSLHVIRSGDRQILIGVHPAGFTVIGDLGADANKGAPSLS